MTDHDPIAHLDFPIPQDIAPLGDSVRYESLEAGRINLLYTFFDHMKELDAEGGCVNLDDKWRFMDRLQALHERMEPELEKLGLHEGDVVQARVPNLVYAADLMAEFTAGEAVRARLGGLAIYPHYGVAQDGKPAIQLLFGLNLSVSKPETISPEGVKSIDGIVGMDPMISLHHDTVDLHRVILD